MLNYLATGLIDQSTSYIIDVEVVDCNKYSEILSFKLLNCHPVRQIKKVAVCVDL